MESMKTAFAVGAVLVGLALWAALALGGGPAAKEEGVYLTVLDQTFTLGPGETSSFPFVVVSGLDRAWVEVKVESDGPVDVRVLPEPEVGKTAEWSRLSPGVKGLGAEGASGTLALSASVPPESYAAVFHNGGATTRKVRLTMTRDYAR